MAAARRVIYVLEDSNTRVRHRRVACIVAPSTVARLEVTDYDSVWVLFDECKSCAKRDEPYEVVEP